DVKPVTEIKPAISIYIKGRHTAGFRCTTIQADETGVGCGKSTEATRPHTNPVTVSAETEIGDECGVQGVGCTQSQALISRQRTASKMEGGRTASLIAVSAGGVLIEVGQTVTAKEVHFFRKVVVNPAIVLVGIKLL